MNAKSIVFSFGLIFLQAGKILPVDSKFSLENYNRLIEEGDKATKEAIVKRFKIDLKNRIDETSKYIRPNENPKTPKPQIVEE